MNLTIEPSRDNIFLKPSTTIITTIAPEKVTSIAQRLGVKPTSVGFCLVGENGKAYSLIDMMNAFLDRIERAG